MEKRHADIELDGSDPEDVARALVKIIGLPVGKRPFSITIDAANMGYEVMATMGDPRHAEIMTVMGLKDILKPVTTR